MSERFPRETCYICDFDTSELLEKHHLVPQRHGGGEGENIVHLCPRCHEALERLYDKRFYQWLGVEKDDGLETGGECLHSECSREDTILLKKNGFEISLCEDHKTCTRRGCSESEVTPIPKESGGCTLFCEKHQKCMYRDCPKMGDVFFESWMGWKVMCREHRSETDHKEDLANV